MSDIDVDLTRYVGHLAEGAMKFRVATNLNSPKASHANTV